MPCRDEGRAEYEYGKEIQRLKQRLDTVTALLCAALAAGDDALVKVPGLREWWDLHQLNDARRLAEEQQEQARRRLDNQRRADRLEAEAAALRAKD